MTTPTLSDELRQIQSIYADQNFPDRENLYPSTCRHCRFYKPEGRRGGHCQQMEALVHSSWRACILALSAFEPSWKGAELHRRQ